jgi:beta-phosphoglucomutase
MNRMLRGAIFDFDGVIVDSHPAHKRAWKRFLQSIGRQVSDADLQFVLGGRTREDILRHFLGNLEPEEIAEYAHRKEQMFRDEAASVQTVKGLKPFLEDLENAQIELAIASSGSRTRLNFLLSLLNLARYFRVVVTADDVIRGKPDPAVFLKAAKGLRLDPAELIAFEDADSGVKAARAAGISCVGIGCNGSSEALLAAGAMHVVEDFRFLSYSRLHAVLSFAV